MRDVGHYAQETPSDMLTCITTHRYYESTKSPDLHPENTLALGISATTSSSVLLLLYLDLESLC